MARPKKIKEIVEMLDVEIQENTCEKIETPIIEKRNFSVIVKETKKPAIIKKSEYDPLIHVAI
jgi:hypothetical protein